MTHRPPGPGLRTILLRLSLVGALIALDLWSKQVVFDWLEPLEGTSAMVRDSCGHERMHVLGEDLNWFTFMLSRNPGAAFGQFASIPHVLVGGRILAVLFLLYLLGRTPRGRRVFSIAILLILSGALGNLYDNLLLPADLDHPYGKVRDFIDVYFEHWRWHFPTFNVADSCITVGAVLLLLTGLVKPPKEEEKPPEPVAEPSPPTQS